MLKREKQQPKVEQIIERLRNLMQGGELVPGDRLLPERELAKALQVSRASIREALRALEAMGLIETSPDGGALVKAPSLEQLVEPIARSIVNSHERLMDLIEARRVLETEATRMAAERATPQELLAIQAAAEATRVEHLRNAPGEASDMAFHLAIADACQNQIFTDFIRALYRLMPEVYGPRRQELADLGETFIAQHLEISCYLAKGQADAAAGVANEHLGLVESALAKLINQEQDESK